MQVPTLQEVEKEIERRTLTRSHLEFSKKFFKAKEAMDFIEAPFHNVLCDTLDRVFTGEIKRLVINIFPGAGKTELGVINFIARGFAINSQARFLHISYAQPLALDNSSKVRDTLNLEEYQDVWPITLRSDTNAKGLWRTNGGGALRAASSGEPITGFRAGYMDPTKFTGAMIIDDPLKPDDALSDKERTHVNNRYMNTFKSRLAHEDIPVIVIMQRLHVDDFTNHLLTGGSGEKWHHLVLPVEIEQGVEPEQYSHAIPVEHDLKPGPLWSFKHDEKSIQTLKVDEYTSSGQYYQRPTPLGGALFKDTMFETFNPDDIPQFEYRFIAGDTAMTSKTSSDYSAFGLYAWSKTKRLYLLEMLRFKKDIPEMEAAAIAFFEKHKESVWLTPHQRVTYGSLRHFLVENKSSGTGLIQRLKRARIPVVSIERTKDKVQRALDATPELTVSPLMVPRDAPWLKDFTSEVLSFTPEGTAKHDDQTDTLMDAVDRTMLSSRSMMDVL